MRFSGIYDSIFIMGHHQLFLLSKLKFDFKEGQMMEFGYRKWSHSDPDLEPWFGFLRALGFVIINNENNSNNDSRHCMVLHESILKI